jgi:hypothetical protein
MTFISGIPSWLVMVLGFMFMGNVMRLVFSRGRLRSRGRWEQLGREEVDRLEAAINQRDVVIEDLQQRMSELESRLDFTERMISSRSEVS